MIININNKVEVILTQKGAEVLNKYNEEIRKVLGNTTFYKYYPTNYREGDTFVEQLWEIMRVFGNSLYTGCDPLFENNEINI